VNSGGTIAGMRKFTESDVRTTTIHITKLSLLLCSKSQKPTTTECLKQQYFWQTRVAITCPSDNFVFEHSDETRLRIELAKVSGPVVFKVAGTGQVYNCERR
ncbi:hypothetical protein HDU84_008195, partial [Entophlyctis sp. JEL0112]